MKKRRALRTALFIVQRCLLLRSIALLQARTLRRYTCCYALGLAPPSGTRPPDVARRVRRLNCLGFVVVGGVVNCCIYSIYIWYTISMFSLGCMEQEMSVIFGFMN